MGAAAFSVVAGRAVGFAFARPLRPHCPAEFKTQARDLLLAMRGRASGWESIVATDAGLRQVLLKFIADFANWDNAAKSEHLERVWEVVGREALEDVARRFAQPLGIYMDEWESGIIETEKGVVRLRPVTQRSKEMFGECGADTLADEIETNTAASAQFSLFPDEPPAVRGRSRRRGRLLGTTASNLNAPLQATTLDRVHAAMLFQASGRTEVLRNLLRAEQERGPDFLRLANALSALYSRGSEEKRLLDGMLLAAPR